MEKGLHRSKGFISDPGGIQRYGVIELPNNELLRSFFFPNVTDLYAGNNAGGTDFNGAAWTGGINGTELGAFTQGNNHVGKSVFCIGDGNEGIRLDTDAFDTANENLSASVWYNITDFTTDRDFVSKYSAVNADKSLRFFYNQTTDTIDFDIYYDAAGNKNSLSIAATAYKDSKPHKFECKYKYIGAAEAYMSIIIDGVARAHIKLTTNTGRNNSAGADLTFGGFDTTGNTYGALSDWWYKKDFLELNEDRKIYAAGSRKPCAEDGNGQVYINGKQPVRLAITPPNYSKDPATNNTFYIPTSHNIPIPENGNYTVGINCGRIGVKTNADTLDAQVNYQFGKSATPGSSLIGLLNTAILLACQAGVSNVTIRTFVSGINGKENCHFLENEIVYLNIKGNSEDHSGNPKTQSVNTDNIIMVLEKD